MNSLAEKYGLLLDFAREPIRQVVGEIAGAEGPVLFFCAAGKDRTGLIAALLLSLVGVGDDEIVADYVRSEERLSEIHAKLARMRGIEDIMALMPPYHGVWRISTLPTHATHRLGGPGP